MGETLYVQPHVSQFDGSAGQGSACTPSSGANGVAASTGGKVTPTGGEIHRLIPKSEETDPSTSGWSMVDLDRAMSKIGIPFAPGEGWGDLEAAHDAGHYIVVQGDSDQFANSTCSGVFDGDHCIGVHPKTKIEGGFEWWWTNDPVCKTGRWEKKSVIRKYAEDFAARAGAVRFGKFTNKVPLLPVPVPTPPAVTLRWGAYRLTPKQTKKIRVKPGTRAKVRTRPDRIRREDVVRRLPNGRRRTMYQKTKKGVLYKGSRVWFGNASGTRWLHVSSF